jgi:hypothetical protein
MRVAAVVTEKLEPMAVTVENSISVLTIRWIFVQRRAGVTYWYVDNFGGHASPLNLFTYTRVEVNRTNLKESLQIP